MVVSQSDILDNLTRFRRVPQRAVIIPVHYSLSVAENDCFCISERPFSSFTDDTNVLCDGFIRPILRQPTENAQTENQYLKDSFGNKNLFLKAEKSAELFVWLNRKEKFLMLCTHNIPTHELFEVFGIIFSHAPENQGTHSYCNFESSFNFIFHSDRNVWGLMRRNWEFCTKV